MSACGGRCNADKVTEGVDCGDTTDAMREDVTDDRITATPATQSSQARTHEKADMAVVSAALPGESFNWK